MQRRATMTRSSGPATRAKMNGSLALLVCCVVGSAVGYNVRREAPYHLGPNDPYSVAVNPNFSQEPSQRLFWGTQGTNQVGGTGLWASLTNKFPFLGNMFGRMELPTEYGVPNQYDTFQQFSAGNQAVSPQYGTPNQYVSSHYVVPGYQQPQFNQVPQFYQQAPRQQQFVQRFVPSGRDVGLTDDAVIVTPPFVPVNQPAPVPVPAPAPAPVPTAPAPAPQPSPGYQYDKPQVRFEYPLK